MKTTWNYDADVVTVTFDPGAIKGADLKQAILDLGYAVATPSVEAGETRLTRAPIDDATPVFLRREFEASRRAGKLLVVHFTATWCAACKKLKTRTLRSDALAPLWKRATLVDVDLDAHPEVGGAFGVGAVPDVFFVAPDGRIVDRLRAFEPPEAFGARMRRLLSALK